MQDPTLSDQDLLELGVTIRLHRKRLLDLISRYKKDGGVSKSHLHPPIMTIPRPLAHESHPSPPYAFRGLRSTNASIPPRPPPPCQPRPNNSMSPAGASKGLCDSSHQLPTYLLHPSPPPRSPTKIRSGPSPQQKHDDDSVRSTVQSSQPRSLTLPGGCGAQEGDRKKEISLNSTTAQGQEQEDCEDESDDFSLDFDDETYRPESVGDIIS